MDKTFVWSHSKQFLMNSHHTSREEKKSKTKALSFHISTKMEIIFFKIISNSRKEKKKKIFLKTQPAQKQQSLLLSDKKVVVQCGHFKISPLQKHLFGLIVGPTALQVTQRSSDQIFALIEIWQIEG